MTDTKQSRLTATLLCVTPPDERQEQGIRAFLQKKYGEDVALTIQQDSSLKSGFQLHVGSEVYDWSAKGRMEQFRQQVEQLVAKNTRKDIIPLLRSSIDEFRLLAKSSEVGTVKSIGDGIAVVEGLEHAAYGEILMFDNGIKGMVQDLRRNETGCILFD
ncbi:MAG: F0F1 ATP synthase subunit delta, partial [Christensenellales bacterium]